MGIQITATGGVRHTGPFPGDGIIPRNVLISLANFLLDKQSGAYILYIEMGEVRKIKKEVVEKM